MTDERTEDGKWKIGQCSVGPETAKACMAWPKLTKNANFGPNLVVFGQKILFFTGEIKSFVTHITENPPRHLVHIVFWSGIGQKVQKMAIFGPK